MIWVVDFQFQIFYISFTISSVVNGVIQLPQFFISNMYKCGIDMLNYLYVAMAFDTQRVCHDLLGFLGILFAIDYSQTLSSALKLNAAGCNPHAACGNAVAHRHHQCMSHLGGPGAIWQRLVGTVGGHWAWPTADHAHPVGHIRRAAYPERSAHVS